MDQVFGRCLVDLLNGNLNHLLFIRRIGVNCRISLLIAVFRAELRDLLRCAFVRLTRTRFFADLMLGIVTPPLACHAGNYNSMNPHKKQALFCKINAVLHFADKWTAKSAY